MNLPDPGVRDDGRMTFAGAVASSGRSAGLGIPVQQQSIRKKTPSVGGSLSSSAMKRSSEENPADGGFKFTVPIGRDSSNVIQSSSNHNTDWQDVRRRRKAASIRGARKANGPLRGVKERS